VITVSLIGGLGNQMFQYAAGKALAERHGVALALDLSGFGNYALRSFLLDRLSVPEADLASVSEAGAGKPANHFVRSLWKQRIDRMLGRVGLPKLAPSANHYREPHFHYDPAFEGLGPQTSLFGYFQSERYFSSIAESLRGWLLPREPFGVAAAEVLGRIELCPLPVSIHVRRGDYLNPGTAEFHGILGEPYYRQAIGRIEATLGEGMDFFVFSDDPAAAEQVLNFVPKSRLNHVRGDPERPWEDMALMARCRHHVTANSSFSWWGAWLNRSPDKIVVAPRAWFAPAELKKLNTTDLYPPGWFLV
jgi:Glycosyl transferase family 11